MPHVLEYMGHYYFNMYNHNLQNKYNQLCN